MSNANDVANILYAYAERSGSPRADFERLIPFARRYVEHHVDATPDLRDLEDNLDNLLAARLIELEKEGRCDVEYLEGRIVGVYYPEYFTRNLKRRYARLRERTVLPFPHDEALNVPIPSGLVRPINVTADFVELLRDPPESRMLVLRLLFPEQIRSLLVPADLLPETFPLLLLQKIRNYLRTSQNASYMHSRLQSIFPNRNLAVKEIIDKAMTSPEEALGTITSPTDFSFHLWTSLSTVIIKEFGQKTEPLPEDHDYAQAAYLIGYYAVHYNTVRQEARDLDAALKAVDSGFQHEPYAYTISQVYEIQDSRGVPVSKRCSRSDINGHLSEQLKPQADSKLPKMLRLKAPDDAEYYVAIDRISTVLLQRIPELSQELNAFYLNSWSDILRSERSVGSMTDDAVFERDVEEQLRRRDPVLMALLSYRVISTALQGSDLSETVRKRMLDLVDSKQGSVRSYTEILDLNREKIYRDARLTLPVWQAVPMLYAIVKFVRFIFRENNRGPRGGGKRRRRGAAARPPRTTAEAFNRTATAEIRLSGSGSATSPMAQPPSRSSADAEGGSAESRDQRVQYRNAVRRLQREYTGDNKSVDETLNELIERWNPLIDPKAKQDLVEDVNALVRDFLRRMRSGLRSHPPDRRRIKTLATNLCEKDALQEIKRREPLQRYVELYMLKLLGK